MVRNRVRWTIEAIQPDGSIVVTTPRDGRVTLPGTYVVEQVELAYAETIHAAQGRTVDRSLMFVDGPIDGSALYVALTRDRHLNEAYVATDPDQSGSDVLEEALARTWADMPAIEHVHAQAQRSVRQTDGLTM